MRPRSSLTRLVPRPYETRAACNRAVVAHIVDDPDKPVVEHREGVVEDFLERRHRGAAGRPRLGTLGGDLLALLQGQRHLSPHLRQSRASGSDGA